MRQQIIERLEYIRAASMNFLDHNRYNDLYYSEYFNKHDISTDEVTHISEIDFNNIPDNKLVAIFESVVVRFYHT